MNFDRSKVVDSLCDNLETYVGWRGYCSDMLVVLKSLVEKNDEYVLREIRQVKKEDEFPFATNDLQYWQFFYPVEPPKKEPKLVPFDNCQELIDWFRRHVGIKSSNIVEPMIWVKKIGYDERHIITDFNEEHQNCVVGGLVFKMHDLSTNFTLLDGTPIGKEEE